MTGTNGTGIEMDALGTETLNATALENKVNSWDVAILFIRIPGTTLNGVTNDNNLSNILHCTINLVYYKNGTCNWYGTIVPATIQKISGFGRIPHLIFTNGTDFNATGLPTVRSSCNGMAATMNIKLMEGFYNDGQTK